MKFGSPKRKKYIFCKMGCAKNIRRPVANHQMISNKMKAGLPQNIETLYILGNQNVRNFTKHIFDGQCNFKTYNKYVFAVARKQRALKNHVL